MSELGKRLKKAREEKQLSLDDLQATTKIQKRYLSAIESGEFSVLPGTFYARAFIKSYAEAVGLDHETLFEEFQRELPNPHENDSELPSRAERVAEAEQSARSERRERRRRTEHDQKVRERVQSGRDRALFTGIVPIILAGIVIVSIAAGVYVYMQKLNPERDLVNDQQPNNQDENVVGNFNKDLPKESTPPAKDEDKQNSPSNEDEGMQEEPPAPKQLLELKEVSGKTSYYDLKNTDEFKVELRFSGASYLDIKDKNKKKLDVQVKTKDGDVFTYDFTAEEFVDLNIGSSNYATILINGEELPFQDKPAHQHIIISFVKAE